MNERGHFSLLIQCVQYVSILACYVVNAEMRLGVANPKNGGARSGRYFGSAATNKFNIK